jgi:hypothetical protein
MTDYIALLKERISEKHLPHELTKRTKPTSVSFVSDGSRPFQKNAPAALARNWIEGLDRLSTADPPGGFSPDRWRQLIDDGHAFLDRWGEQAARLGWAAKDLFGVHPAAPAVRYDAMGLVPLIAGRRVIAMTADTALIGTRNGILTYRRSRVNAVSLWELRRAASNDKPAHSHGIGR